MTRQKSNKGTVGTDLELHMEPGSQKKAWEVVVNAPLADDDATLVIYKDSVAVSNELFNGYMADRDSNGAVPILDRKEATSKLIVRVTGGSGDLFAMVIYD